MSQTRKQEVDATRHLARKTVGMATLLDRMTIGLREVYHGILFATAEGLAWGRGTRASGQTARTYVVLPTQPWTTQQRNAYQIHHVTAFPYHLEVVASKHAAKTKGGMVIRRVMTTIG
jgi:hypothetical protein